MNDSLPSSNQTMLKNREAIREMSGHLFSVLQSCPQNARLGTGCLHAFVEQELLNTFPALFSSTSVVREFLDLAIALGLVPQEAQGPLKTLQSSIAMPSNRNAPSKPNQVSAAPLPLKMIPEKA